MALINCPECGKEISDSAMNCPNCGYPINKKSSEKIVISKATAGKVFIALFAIFLIVFVAWRYYQGRKTIIGDWQMKSYYGEDGEEKDYFTDVALHVEDKSFTLRSSQISQKPMHGTWELKEKGWNSSEYLFILPDEAEMDTTYDVKEDVIRMNLKFSDKSEINFLFVRE